MSNKYANLIVNFGGPRSLEEIYPFLRSLLTDKDVIRTRFPQPIHNWMFSRIAKKRALQIAHDYQLIGGKSPIFEDTEAVARQVSEKIQAPVLTFHRYLPQTHEASLAAIGQFDKIKVFPMFPQFSYATTGSIARLFSKQLDISRLAWIKSYCTHPAFIRSMQNVLRDFLQREQLEEKETVLLFSPHGVPQEFIHTGDIYERECRLSFEAIRQAFPQALHRLAYQSKFGRGEWIRPYTVDVCEDVLSWYQGRPNIVFVPLSFTSDHIETLFEVDYQYLPILRQKGLNAYRCPALNRLPDWIAAIGEIFQESNLFTTQQLIR